MIFFHIKKRDQLYGKCLTTDATLFIIPQIYLQLITYRIMNSFLEIANIESKEQKDISNSCLKCVDLTAKMSKVNNLKVICNFGFKIFMNRVYFLIFSV